MKDITKYKQSFKENDEDEKETKYLDIQDMIPLLRKQLMKGTKVDQKQKKSKEESKEATGSGSSGAYSAPMFSGEEPDLDKVETKESSMGRMSPIGFSDDYIKKSNSEKKGMTEGENKPTNPKLWSRAKSMAKSKFDVYPSAYANGWAAKWYKSKGGGWKKKPKNESIQEDESMNEDLRRWFKEKWVDVSKKVDGKHPPCGRKDADGKSYPKCRPSKKVSKETPKVASSYDKDEKEKMVQQKRRAEKKDPKIGKGNKPTMTHFNETLYIEEQIEKIEATEATGSGSTGGYESPAMWAKSTKKKDWGPSRKTQIPGGGFVKVKKKCTKFPYCNQGDINALKITKNETVKEAIKQVASRLGINESTIITILEYEYEKVNKRQK
jgi:hypothetical protein